MKTVFTSRQIKLFAGLSLLVFGLLLSACGTTTNITVVEKEEATETGTETRDLSEDTALSLTITSGVGDLRIQGADNAAAITIDYKKIAYGETKEEARTELAGVTLDITQNDNAITIDSVQQTESGNRSNQVELTITVPRDLVLQVTQNVGSVDIIGLAPTSPLTASVGVGDLKLTRVDAGAGLTLTTGVGSISFRGTIGGEDLYSFTTSTGDISVRVPSDENAEIDARTDVGDITTSGLTLHARVDDKQAAQQALTATLGDGGPALKLRTGVGSITIAKS